MRYDVVIIGGGTSAAFAALKLKEAGVSTIIISDSKPSASMGCGEFFSGGAGEAPELTEQFKSAFFRVFRTYRQKTDSYININGTIVKAHFVPSTTLGLSEIPERGLALISLPGIHDTPIEINVLDSLKSKLRTEDIQIIHTRLQSSIEEYYLSPIQWAARTDDPLYRMEIMQRMIFQLKGIDADTFILPPFLGISRHEEFLNILSDEISASVYEMLGIPGWPPGLRAGLLVEQALSENGFEIIKERAVSAERKAGGDIEGISTSGGTQVMGRFFILATGGICGGGLIFQSTLTEPVCNLPVFMNGKKVAELSTSESLPAEIFWSERFQENKAIASAGISIDNEGRPLNEYGRPVSYNLRACGSIVNADKDLRRNPIDPGVSALSGWSVAEKLIQAL